MTTASEEPRCPFCYHRIEQPKELPQRKVIEFPIGACAECGAVYVYDATGHNLGSAFIEAILFACNEDDYLAFSLSHGDDYTDAVIGNYDIVTHTIVPDKIHNDRYVRGALLFVRLFGQFLDATEEKVKEKLKYTTPIIKTKLRSEKFSRGKIRQDVAENNLTDLLALAEEDTRVLNELQRMLYTPDEHLRWKIIDIFGLVSRKVAEKRPDIVSKLIHNLLQSAASPGASPWGALETIGTVISINPGLFGEFTKPLLSFLVHENLRKELLWAIGKIATADPDLAKYAFRHLSALLDDKDPVVRGYAAWALGSIGFSDMLDKLKSLETDENKISLWRDGELREVTVAWLAKEAAEKITR
jgi:hypothetical protein